MTDTAHVVLIEDEESNRTSLTRALVRVGYRVDAFEAVAPAVAFLREQQDVSLVVTDLKLPDGDGFEVLREARTIHPEIGVLMITGHGSVESAVEAMKKGADDYLTKPVDLFELRKRASAIIEKRLLSRRVDELESRLGEKFGNIVGRSKAMEELFRRMEMVAPTRANVLIIGESGTGKELVANALHDHSPRKDARFLPINCAAIPAEILESELFGHERGAFTGATARKIGKFELAHGGTLFLDEIGELPLDMQVKLLRVLEQREFMRVGGTETIKVEIRLVAATNADLEKAVENGTFRSDLYYRLKVVTLQIPSLRERREDIPLLATHFLEQYARENERPDLRFSADAMRALVSAPWEGNVRELRNTVESLVVLTPGDVFEFDDLPEEIRSAVPEPVPGEAPSPPAIGETGGASAAVPSAPAVPVGLTMDEIERQAILGALESTGGNRTKAAEMLGIGLRTLQRKLKEYQAAGADGSGAKSAE